MSLIIKDGVKYASGTNLVELTQAQYDQLSSAQKNNGNFYLITDAVNSAYELSNLADVSITGTPSAGQVLAYDGSNWGNKTVSIDKIGDFLLGKLGDNKSGDINLSESIENARALIFTVSLATVSNPIRASLTVPIYALINYGVFQDYTIGSDRNYWQISKTNNTKLSVSGTSIASSSNFYLNVWIIR